MSRVLVVQHITVVGITGPNGGLPKPTRDTVKIPVERLECREAEIVLHTTSYGRSRFSNPYGDTVVDVPEQPLKVGCVTITHTEEEVSATFRYDRRCAGAPNRSWVVKTLTVPANAWGQIRYNGRFSTESSWRYLTVIVNVGLFEHLSPKLFTQQEPLCRFASMAKLTR